MIIDGQQAWPGILEHLRKGGTESAAHFLADAIRSLRPGYSRICGIWGLQRHVVVYAHVCHIDDQGLDMPAHLVLLSLAQRHAVVVHSMAQIYLCKHYQHMPTCRVCSLKALLPYNTWISPLGPLVVTCTQEAILSTPDMPKQGNDLVCFASA
jgi:hypothetical protein